MSNKKVKNTGIMNKMRDKMPLIIIILIIAFLATIVFEWGMDYMGIGTKVDAFAKINSEEIKYDDYEKAVNAQIDQMMQQNQGKEVDEATRKQIRDQVWNSMVSRILMQQALDKYGITVSDKEVLDWVYNKPETLPEPIKRNFMDSTGVFNASLYQQALTMKTPEITRFWTEVYDYLKETLMFERVQAIVSEGVVISEADVLDAYKDNNIFANFSYALLDLNSVKDSSLFSVTDEELKKYYEDNKNDYKQNESIKLKYVIFPNLPSKEDSAAVMKQMELLRKQMETASLEDSSIMNLIARNSQVSWNDEFQKSSNFEPPVQNFLFSAKPGDLSKVYIGQDGYQVLKLLDVKEGADLYSNATHILIKIENNDTSAAKKEAEDLMTRIKNGEDIENLALQYSDDPSVKDNRGNLGWFTKGAMVKEFEEAVDKGKKGDVVGPILSRYGFHVIKVGGKEKKEFKVAQMTKQPSPSSRTLQQLKKDAEDFYAELKKGQNMDSLAKQKNLQVQLTADIPEDGTIPGAPDSKKLYKFFKESKVNTITDVINGTGGPTIFEMIQKNPKGYQNFDSIKTTLIKPKVVNEKKYNVLLGQAKELETKIQNGDINSLSSVAPQYSYGTIDTFSVGKPGTVIGQDYALADAVFSLKPGEISKPIRGAKGYYIVKLNSVTEFNQQDYNVKAVEIRKNLFSSKKQQIVSEWMSRMQSDAEIIDNRDKFLN